MLLGIRSDPDHASGLIRRRSYAGRNPQRLTGPANTEPTERRMHAPKTLAGAEFQRLLTVVVSLADSPRWSREAR